MPIGSGRHRLVLFIGVGCAARDLQRAFDAVERLPDHAHAVDGVGAGWPYRTSFRAPCLGQHRVQRALHKGDLEGVCPAWGGPRRAGARWWRCRLPQGRHRIRHPPGLVRDAPHAHTAAPVLADDRRHGDEGEGKGRPGCRDLAVDVTTGTGLGVMTAVMISPGFSSVSICGVSPGRRWKSAMPIRRLVPSAVMVSTSASSTLRATAMSLGCVAMQASLRQ